MIGLRLTLTEDEAAHALGLSPNTFMQEIKAGRYPPARQISPGRKGWLIEDLQEAVRRLPVFEGLPPKNSGYGRAGKPKKAKA